MSLCARGTPCSRPAGWPVANASSAALAAARAPAVSMRTKAFSVGWRIAMRVSAASVTSRADTLRAAMAAAVLVSVQSAICVMTVPFCELAQYNVHGLRLGVEQVALDCLIKRL